MDKNEVTVAPVAPERLDDLVALFESRGGPHYCWCSLYRDPPRRAAPKAEKKAALLGRVDVGEPVGVLAYVKGIPVGWCSVAPRESYGRLDRSRTMPRATDASVSTWSIMCLFVKRDHRGQGVAQELVAGAIEHARAAGADVVEAYPFDTAGTTATHRGHSSLFQSAGFAQDGIRWSLSVERF